MTPTVKVLFYEPYPMGLSGNFLTQRLILERLDRARFTPIVISPIEGVALDEFRKMGVECVVISPPGNLDRYGGNVLRDGIPGRLKAAIDLLRYNITLSHFFRARRIDVVYANCVRAAMTVGFACKFISCRLLLYVKGELRNPLIDRISFYLSDRILFMSKYMLNSSHSWIGKFYRHKVEVLRGGVDSEEVLSAGSNDKKTALSREIGIDTSKVNTLVIGQLNRPKGQHLVIQALKNLINDHDNVRLYIVGDEIIKEYSHYKTFLKALVKDFQLENHVHFLEWRKDAWTIMALMDIVINPSLTEGFGYVVVESMLLGRPIIASKTGIAPEIIRDGENGFLIDIGDEVAIERRWRELLVNQELRQRLGQAARKSVLAEYLIDDKVARLAEIWTEMARDKA
jgi:glycosyltransferase involved in cell wall biosynthesis